MAQEILEKAGFVIEIAENGQKGLEAVRKRSFDLVLMDIQMPIMDGYETTREIRKIPQFSDLPILAMSASAMTQDREESIAAGMNDHVPKPIDLQQLFSALLKWIKPGKRTVPSQTQNSKRIFSKNINLPDSIPGINIKKGIARVSGKKSLYKDLLITFYQD